jgi:hypothetical protein
MSKSKKRRPSLFSLSARMQRRTAMPTVNIDLAGDGDHDEDDDCPICIAAREGKPISFDVLHDPAYLIAEARRVLQRTKLAPGEEISIVETGRLMPDETYDIVRYSVDATGRIYLTRNGAKSVVMRIAMS